MRALKVALERRRNYRKYRSLRQAGKNWEARKIYGPSVGGHANRSHRARTTA